MQSMTQLKTRRIRFAIALAGIAFVSAYPIDQACAQTKIVEGFVSHGALQPRGRRERSPEVFADLEDTRASSPAERQGSLAQP